MAKARNGLRQALTTSAATAAVLGVLLIQAVWEAPATAGATTTAAAATSGGTTKYPSPTKIAKDLAHQKYLQQQRAAHASANAAKRAAEFARASRISQAVWISNGRPALLTVVGPTRVYIVRDGVLQLYLARPAGPLSVQWLAENLPDQWVSWPARGVARLNSALVVIDGSALTADSGDLSTLQLVDGAWIRVSRGSFALTGVTVTSYEPATGKALPPTDPKRPFIRAGRAATLTLDGVTASGLGNASGTDDSGITWGTGATGHATAVKVTGGYTGLRLSGSVAVALKQVTVTGSAKDGLVLVNDTGTTLAAVTADGNGGNGLRIGRGPRGRTVSGLVTSGNTGFGVAAENAAGVVIDKLTSSDDTAGGIDLTACTACAVSGATTTGDRFGAKIGRGSNGTIVTGGTFTGGDYGVFVSGQATGVTLNGITVNAARVYGVGISGHNVTLSGGAVASTGTGVRIGPGADTVVVSRVTVSGGNRAGITAGGTNVTVSHVKVQGGHVGIQVFLHAHNVLLDTDTVDDARDAIDLAQGTSAIRIVNPALFGFPHDGIANSSAGLSVTGGQLHGGGTAIETQSSMSLTGSQIDSVREGVHVARAVTLDAKRISILATKTGASIASGGQLVLDNSRVLAPIGIKGDVRYVGDNVVALPPFPWLGVVAIAAILLGFILEALHATRQPKRRPTRDVAPLHVHNVA